MTIRRLTLAIASLTLVVVAWACDTPTAPLPPGAVSIDPPSAYTWWWEQTQSCANLSASLSGVHWYIVPGASSVTTADGREAAGYWDSRTRRIVLAGAFKFLGDVVRHEMLHALLDDAKKHPRAYFLQKCAGVVDCDDACISDGGVAAPADASAIHVTEDELTVTVSIVPSAPSSALYEGNFQMVITATNPRSVPVIVDLAPSGDSGPPFSFGYQIEKNNFGHNFDWRAEVPEASRFAANESKRMLVDLHTQPGDTRYDLGPGPWTFKGRFGSRWASTFPTVTVEP